MSTAGTVNKVIVVGNLGRDPEIHTSVSGDRMATLSVATCEQWKDRHNGERRERTEWHRIVVFAKGLVDVIEQYLRKGMKVYLEGQLQTRKWKDQDGNDRYSTEVVLSAFKGVLTILTTRRDRGDEGDGGSTEIVDWDAQSGGGATATGADDLEDKIPF